jgi:ADP-heptose:LPS heptosyltransferase
MVETNPRLSRVLNAHELGAGRPSWRQVRRLTKRVRAELYDTCLVLDRSPVLAAIPWLAGVPQRIGLDSAGRGFCHHVRIPVRGVRHETDIYLETVRALGAGVQGVQTEFYPTDSDRAAATDLLRTQLQWSEGEPLFVLHPAGGRNPGAAMVSKRWLPERFAVVANRLLNEYGGKAILLGGPQDRAILETVRGLIGLKTLAVAGEVAWGVWGALLEKAMLCLGNDTGATHLAVAVGCKTVFVFGPSDPRRYGPYARQGQAAALWHPVPGLHHGVHRGPPKNWTWDEAVSAQEVWHAVQALIGQPGAEAVQAVTNSSA